MDKAVFGLFGSFASHQVFNAYGAETVELGFSFGCCDIKCADSFSQYAKEVQFLCVDFLEERAHYSGEWEEQCTGLIDMIQANFKPWQVFLFEFYLAERVEIAGKPYRHAGLEGIQTVNRILNDKYLFFKNHFPSINVIQMDAALEYTDRFHDYGCLPEHLNLEAYQYAAKKICEKIAVLPKVTAIARRDSSSARREKPAQAELDFYSIRDAHRISCMYGTLRDWMYKKTIQKPLDACLKAKGYESIAIYGVGDIGRLFMWEMEGTGITIQYAIDRNAEWTFAEVPVLKPSDDWPPVDAIIVCVPLVTEEIRLLARGKTEAKVFSLDQLIYWA